MSEIGSVTPASVAVVASVPAVPTPAHVASDANGAPVTPHGITLRGGAVNPTVATLQSRFADAIVRHDVVWGETTVYVQREFLFDIVHWLATEPSERYDYLVDVTAVEYRDAVRPIEVVWHLRALERRRFLRLKVELPKHEPLWVPSVIDIYSGADWLERECFDMFGIRFEGHPDLRRILMWNSYAEGFPLRKDFPLRGRFSRAEQLKQALAANPEARYSMEELTIAEAFDALPLDMKERLREGGATTIADGGE